MSAVVSDTSPLHYLVECAAIEILPALFQEILIPPTVHRELQHPRTPPHVRAWAQKLPSWIKVQSPVSVDPTLKVDEGEREAICLAREVKAAAILMDDRKSSRGSDPLRIARGGHDRFAGGCGATRSAGFSRQHRAIASDECAIGCGSGPSGAGAVAFTLK